MARKRYLQPTFEKNQIQKPTEENFGKRKRLQLPSKHPIMKNPVSDSPSNSNGVDSNEIEIISDEDLPSEYQPEDGELSEISTDEGDSSAPCQNQMGEQVKDHKALPRIHLSSGLVGKNFLNRSFTSSYTDKHQPQNNLQIGKSKSKTTPCSPENANTTNILSVVSNIKNKPSRKGMQQIVVDTTSTVNGYGSVDMASPTASDVLSAGKIISCISGTNVDTAEKEDAENKKEEGEIDEIEEMDEDLLYLRLMALRSIDLRTEGPKDDNCILKDQPLQNKNSKQEIQCIDVEDMVDEMEDLLNEADQAAKNKNSNIEDDGIEIIDMEVPIIPVIDIPDSDEEQIDLQLERWTKNKSISIDTLDTNASFQQQASDFPKTKLLETIAENPLSEKESNVEHDYSKLVQRLRQTLERQNQKKDLKHVGKSVTQVELYSPTQSPIKAFLDSNLDIRPNSKQDIDNVKYSPTQSPLSEVVDTPIGSEGTTPGNLTPPDINIPLQIPACNRKTNNYIDNINEIELPPLPPGSPPPAVGFQNHCASTNIGEISLPPIYLPAKTLSLLPTWTLLEQENTRSITPPPPGEEASSSEYNSIQNMKGVISGTVDMELGSDNEAELQFFKDQQEQIQNNGVLYPPSIWNHSNYNTNNYNFYNPERGNIKEFPQPPKMSDVMSFENDQDRYNAFLHAVTISNNTANIRSSNSHVETQRKTRKRKQASKWGNKTPKMYTENTKSSKEPRPTSFSPHSKKHKKSKSQDQNTLCESSEDEDHLRALLLSDMQKKKDKDELEKCKSSPGNKESEITEDHIPKDNTTPIKDKNHSYSGIGTENQMMSNSSSPYSCANSQELSSIKKNQCNAETELTIESNTIPSTLGGIESADYGTGEKKAQEIEKTELLTKSIEKYHELPMLSGPYSAVISELNKLSESTLRVIREIGVNAAIRNFPNLVKPVIITYENDIKSPRKNKPNINSPYLPNKTNKSDQNKDLVASDFATKLDNFMRDARRGTNLSSESVHKLRNIPPPKPVRKHPPRKHAEATNLAPKTNKNTAKTFNRLNSSISPAAKNHLMTASVKSLPLKKQEEYRRLKDLIAKKEASKKKFLKKKAEGTPCAKENILPQNINLSCSDTHGIRTAIGCNESSDKHINNPQVFENQANPTVDEAEMLRQSLLSNLKKTVSIDANSEIETRNAGATFNLSINDPLIGTVSPSSSATKPSMKISVSNNGDRNVSVTSIETDSNVRTSKSDSKKAFLNKKENELSSIRKSVTNHLYKLSAHLSQLKNETNRKETAEEYLSNLHHKISEVEALIVRKNERIGQIKGVVLHSHNEISTRRKEMVIVENECKTLGKQLVGAGYKPPQESTRKIREKIALIKKHAKQIQPEDKMLQCHPGSVISMGHSNTLASDADKRLTEPYNKNLLPQEESNFKQPTSDQMDRDDEEQKDNEHTKTIITSAGSVFAHLKQSLRATTYDPHKEFCRYELQGKCNDDSCGYQHQFPKV